MKKATFIRLMKELVRLKKVEDECKKAFVKLGEFNFWDLDAYETIALESIREAMEDDEDWTGYWIYELECGKKAKKGSVKIDGKSVAIKTLSNLYDLIVKRK